MERHLGWSPARPLPVVARPIVGPVASASRNARRRFPRGAHPFQGGPLERDLRRYLSSEGHIFDVGAVSREFRHIETEISIIYHSWSRQTTLHSGLCNVTFESLIDSIIHFHFHLICLFLFDCWKRLAKFKRDKFHFLLFGFRVREVHVSESSTHHTVAHFCRLSRLTLATFPQLSSVEHFRRVAWLVALGTHESASEDWRVRSLGALYL